MALLVGYLIGISHIDPLKWNLTLERFLPDFRDKVGAHGWRDLIALAPDLMNAPRGLGQHVGGMILSDTPIPELVPIRAAAMDGR